MLERSGDFYGTDFTCSASMPEVLSALSSSDGRAEQLALAVSQGSLPPELYHDAPGKP